MAETKREGSLEAPTRHALDWQSDEFYDATVVNPLVEGSRRGLAPFDQNVVDGTVNGVGSLVRGIAGRLRGIQTGIVQNYALALVLGVAVVIALMIFV